MGSKKYKPVWSKDVLKSADISDVTSWIGVTFSMFSFESALKEGRFLPLLENVCGGEYSRMDQVKFVEDRV